MKKIGFGIREAVLLSAYLYLSLPIILFFLGWCRWYIGIPAAILCIVSVVFCMMQYLKEQKSMEKLEISWKKAALIAGIIFLWVGFSGVGSYTWQNIDHWWRNEIFELLVNEKWPVISMREVDGVMQERGMVYYLGFWLPSALFGKIFGIEAGYAFQYLWTVIGILIMYGFVCLWRKKADVWPLLLLIFFSGLDIVGCWLVQTEQMPILGIEHLEYWSGYYQYSSMTTQLFWVFNQAVPAWVASMLVFFCEKPKNMLFTCSLLILTATFPFAGLLPFALYFMIVRISHKKCTCVTELIKTIFRQWISVQNIVGVFVIGVISVIYIFGNAAVIDSLLMVIINFGIVKILIILVLFFGLFIVALRLYVNGRGKIIERIGCLFIMAVIAFRLVTLNYNDWQSSIFLIGNFLLFYMLEAGIYLIFVKKYVNEKNLFWLTVVLLFVIPFIKIGASCDFCMRASIPALLLLALWCIKAIDASDFKKDKNSWILAGLLLLGAVTPLHEIKRTYISSTVYYERQYVEEDRIYLAVNFSGDTTGFFWKYIAER